MGFANSVAAGNKLAREALQSPNFVHGSAGWQVARDGSAEFQDITARGTITGATFVVYGNGGVFIYVLEAA